ADFAQHLIGPRHLDGKRVFVGQVGARMEGENPDLPPGGACGGNGLRHEIAGPRDKGQAAGHSSVWTPLRGIHSARSDGLRMKLITSSTSLSHLKISAASSMHSRSVPSLEKIIR